MISEYFFKFSLTLSNITTVSFIEYPTIVKTAATIDKLISRLKNEKNQILAFDSGYNKSKTAVIDANITTLIAAVILFFMGSGPIKGFSVTLGVGIFTTLFSVYYIARLLTSIYVTRNKNKENLIWLLIKLFILIGFTNNLI